jgi:selenide,water dikinase
MILSTSSSPKKRLILLGGSLAHAQVLQSLHHNPRPDIAITLISDAPTSLFAGKLPEYLAGQCELKDLVIDWVQMCAQTGTRFLNAEVDGILAGKKLVSMKGRGSIAYDVLSIGLGGAPLFQGKGAELALSLSRFEQAEKRLLEWTQAPQAQQKNWAGEIQSSGPKISIVGGGAAGVELGFALGRYFRKRNFKPEMTIYESQSVVLPHHNWLTRRAIIKDLDKNKIRVKVNSQVAEIDGHSIRVAGGDPETSDFTWLATGISALPLLKTSELELHNGFVLVTDGLQSVSHPDVFSVGGSCWIEKQKRMLRSSSSTLKQGLVLAENLFSYLDQKRLSVYKPKKTSSLILPNGVGEAYYSYGLLHAQGPRVMKLKARRDARFLSRTRFEKKKPKRRFHSPTPDIESNGVPLSLQVLETEIRKIDFYQGSPVAPSKYLIQNLATFQNFSSDPFLFGQTSAHGALLDLYAVGATPLSAQVVVSLPKHGSPSFLVEDLQQILLGIASVFNPRKIFLMSAQAAWSEALGLSIVVNAFEDSDRLFQKKQLQVGDQIVLTKPLGTGTLLKAHSTQKLDGKSFQALTSTLLQSSEWASRLFKEVDGRSASSIKQMGLAGALEEMLELSGHGASLDVDHLPCIEGSKSWLTKTPADSHHANRESSKLMPEDLGTLRDKVEFDMLFDPQTCGGLILAVPANRAREFVQVLKSEGYTHATTIGAITSGPPKIKFRTNIA